MRNYLYYFTLPRMMLIVASMTASIGLHSQEEPEYEWLAVSIDNDIFVGNDDGYSNGIYLSYYRNNGDAKVDMPILTKWLEWSVSDEPFQFSYDGTTIGQIIVTPTEIIEPIPDPNDIPYSGLLFIHQVNVRDFTHYADKTSVTLGILGPSARAGETQKFVHRMIGSDKPMGWDYQLKDEPVFQISRGRIFRSWASENSHMDYLWGGDVKLGTIESSVNIGMMFRYGEQMASTYSSALLSEDRSTNPIALNEGWYVYAGARLSYVFNLIYLDGNTFKDGPSIDYDRVQLNGSLGLTYAWQDFSVALALNNIELKSSSTSRTNLKKYGSLTFIWRI